MVSHHIMSHDGSYDKCGKVVHYKGDQSRNTLGDFLVYEVCYNLPPEDSSEN